MILDMRDSYDHIARSGVALDPIWFPSAPNDAFDMYVNGVPRQFQRKLVAALSPSIADPSIREQVRIQSCSPARSWISTLPNSPHFVCLDNLTFAFSLRQYLDLPVSDNIPARCSCSAVIDSEFFLNHIHGCTKNRRRGATARHDNLVRLLASICYTAGLNSRVEPNFHRQLGIKRTKPDLLVFLPHATAFVDVTVGDPLCPSHIVQSVREPLSTANDREASKFSKHRKIANAAGMLCLPFGLESFGGFGRSADNLMSLIDQQAALQPWYEPSSTPARSRARIMSCLLHGNLQAYQEGLFACFPSFQFSSDISSSSCVASADCPSDNEDCNCDFEF